MELYVAHGSLGAVTLQDLNIDISDWVVGEINPYSIMEISIPSGTWDIIDRAYKAHKKVCVDVNVSGDSTGNRTATGHLYRVNRVETGSRRDESGDLVPIVFTSYFFYVKAGASDKVERPYWIFYVMAREDQSASTESASLQGTPQEIFSYDTPFDEIDGSGWLDLTQFLEHDNFEATMSDVTGANSVLTLDGSTYTDRIARMAAFSFVTRPVEMSRASIIETLLFENEAKIASDYFTPAADDGKLAAVSCEIRSLQKTYVHHKNDEDYVKLSASIIQISPNVEWVEV